MSWLAHHPDFASGTTFTISINLSAFGSGRSSAEDAETAYAGAALNAVA